MDGVAGSAAMHHGPHALFAFAEPDHLLRIHIRLQLEDAGFRVLEEGEDLRIVEDAARPPARP